MLTTLQFAPMQSSTQTVCVNAVILDDTTLEDSETFFIYLSAANNTIMDGRIRIDPSTQTTVVTILDNDNVTAGIERESYTVYEGDQSVIVCTILEADLERDVQIDFYTIPGTAQGS